ncbi:MULTISPECIES: hypothetical protein [unclassified Methanosarcina]|nr:MULTISPECIES: hypothetical protein [unclassified Methanosarcina]
MTVKRKKKQKMKHGSYFKTDKNFERIVRKVMEDSREVLQALKESGN